MKRKRIINFSAIGLSLIFLFNPNVAVIDFLPDFIGYVLLCIALTNLSDINDTVSQALKIFKKLIIIDVAKLASLMWVFGISVVNERNSSLLLWSFVFAVLEMVFVIPAFLKLFAGMNELGFLYDNTSVIGSKKADSKKNYTDKIRGFTVFFISIKAIMSFLPELADLTTTEYSENMGLTNMYRYIGVARGLAFAPVLVIGTLWIVKTVSYFMRVDRDVVFVEALEKTYAERVTPKTGIFVKRNIALSFAVLMVAFIFSVDFRMESVNMLPDFVCAILLGVFFVVISKKTKVNIKLPVIGCCVYFAISIFAYLSEMYFFKNFYYGAIYRSDEAMTAYTVMAISACASTLVFALICLAVLKCVREVINAHTGITAISENATLTYKNINEIVKKELGRYAVICVAATAIYAISDVCYVLLAKDFGFMFFINVIVAVAFIGTFFKLFGEISEAVNSKYILE